MGHIHFNAVLYETGKCRRGVARADVSDLLQHIQLEFRQLGQIIVY